MLPVETRMKLYQSFIVPHFNYCAETWNFCSKGATTKLEKLNERALRFVYRDYSSSYEMLLKQSGYQTLLNQRLAKILTTVNKVVNRQGVSESLCDLVELRESNYNLRGDKILTLPKVNTTNTEKRTPTNCSRNRYQIRIWLAATCRNHMLIYLKKKKKKHFIYFILQYLIILETL